MIGPRAVSASQEDRTPDIRGIAKLQCLVGQEAKHGTRKSMGELTWLQGWQGRSTDSVQDGDAVLTPIQDGQCGTKTSDEFRRGQFLPRVDAVIQDISYGKGWVHISAAGLANETKEVPPELQTIDARVVLHQSKIGICDLIEF